MSDEILVAEGLTKRFAFGASLLARRAPGVAAVRGVDLKLREGEIFALVGESGSGKSTIARMIVRLLTPSSGRLLYRGQEITALRGPALRAFRREVQMVFQDPGSSLNPRRTVAQTLELPLAVHRVVPREARPARVARLLEMVELPRRFAAVYPHELSGGQKQRVAIARALASGPSLLILDEPTSALDVSVQAKVVALLQGLQRALGLTYLFISHDLSLVRTLATRLAVLYRGEVVETGPSAELFTRPLHPYTRRLLAAIPVVSDEEERLKPAWDTAGEEERLMRRAGGGWPEGAPSRWGAAEGEVQGCSFYARCPLAVDRCRAEAPALVDVGEGSLEPGRVLARERGDQTVTAPHQVRCHLVADRVRAAGSEGTEPSQARRRRDAPHGAQTGA